MPAAPWPYLSTRLECAELPFGILLFPYEAWWDGKRLGWREHQGPRISTTHSNNLSINWAIPLFGDALLFGLVMVWKEVPTVYKMRNGLIRMPHITACHPPTHPGTIEKQEVGCPTLATGRRMALWTIVGRGQNVWSYAHDPLGSA